MINLTGCNGCFRKGIILLFVSAYPIGEVRANDCEPVVRLPRGQMSVLEAIEIIERQTGFVFSYNGDLFDVSAMVAFSDNKLTLKQVLDELITGEKIVCMIRHKYIIVHPKGTEGGFKEEKPCISNADCIRPAHELHDVSPAISPERQEIITAANEQANESLKPSFSSHTSPDFFPGNLSHLPVFAFKSNLLCAAGTLTPNLAVELGVGAKTSLVFSGGYKPWNKDVNLSENIKLIHWVIRPEFRYWLHERFYGHYFSGNVFHVQFNIGGRDVPLAGFSKKYRYEGNACGVGLNWGYQIPLDDRWGLEFSAGMGVAYIYYERLEQVNNRRAKWYKGPTHAAINIVYIIN